jgi:cysteine desulfurase
MQTIYFDFNATTPLDPQVREAMLPYLADIYGNPSSIHRIGRQARALLDEARERVSKVWRCKPSEVIFTSGGTESNNLAVFGAARRLCHRGRHLITSMVEHPSVLECFDYLERKEGFEVSRLPVDRVGRVSLDTLAETVRADTILVSVMAANNEVGTLQPVAEIGAFCRERGIVFHTDAAHWFGKEPFFDINQFNADLVSVCAHKLHGPKGSGALYIRSPLRLDPILLGGSHENEVRAGTENLASIIGMAEVMERFVTIPVFPRDKLLALTNRLIYAIDSLAYRGVVLRGSQKYRLSNTVAFTAQGCDSLSLLAGLDLEGICASSGSACSSGSLEASHVLKAMGVNNQEAHSLVRFSLGRTSTLKEAEQVEKTLPELINRVQQVQETRNCV